MKRLFLSLLLFGSSLLPFYGQKSPEARKVLDATASAFEDAGGIRIIFRADTYSGTQLQGSADGQMTLKGRKFKLITDGVTTWFDGKTQWSYLNENDEVNISHPSKEEMQSMNPYAFLDLYKKGFNYTLSKGTLRNKPVYTVSLKAENPQQDIQEIIIDVQQSDYTPLCIRVRQKGDWGRIVILNYEKNVKLKDDTFRFDPVAFPNAELIDLR